MRTGAEIDRERAVPLFMSEIEQMGGAERSMLALARWLYERGVPVYLLTYADGPGMADHADFPLPSIELKPRGGVRAKVAAVKAHFAQTPLGAPAPITSGYQPALHSSLAGLKRFHCLMHDTPSLFGGESFGLKQRVRFALSNRLIGRGLRRGGGAMIVTSEYLEKECQRDFGVQAVIARMGGLGEAHAFRRRPVRDSLRMLSVCRIEGNKRIDWMLDSLAALQRAEKPLSSRVDWRLDLAGKGALFEQMREKSKELGLSERVFFRGYVPDADLEMLYDEAHLFLMPAVQGYGIPAIEALQRGIPVLLHRDSGVSDILLDTPWVTVLHGGKEEMTPKLEDMIDWLLRNEQLIAPAPPDLPTEETWAERVAKLCGYV